MSYLYSTIANMLLTEFLESDDIPREVKHKILISAVKKLAELNNPLEERVALSSIYQDLNQQIGYDHSQLEAQSILLNSCCKN